jgi:NMD protein affecting ribosome stability and mRNA decay
VAQTQLKPGDLVKLAYDDEIFLVMSVWDVGLKLLKVSTGRQYPDDANTYVKTSMVIKICEGQR